MCADYRAMQENECIWVICELHMRLFIVSEVGFPLPRPDGLDYQCGECSRIIESKELRQQRIFSSLV